MIAKLTKLDPKKFNYKNHESDWWTTFNLSYTESIETEKLIKAINKYAIGYCDGSKLEIKPKSNSYAVMFNVEGYEFWFHINNSENTVFNDFIEYQMKED